MVQAGFLFDRFRGFGEFKFKFKFKFKFRFRFRFRFKFRHQRRRMAGGFAGVLDWCAGLCPG
jgi:hypothetical protein